MINCLILRRQTGLLKIQVKFHLQIFILNEEDLNFWLLIKTILTSMILIKC